jgi:hypothetical protein
MKYVVEYEIRTAGLTHDQNFANQDALLKAFGSWTRCASGERSPGATRTL